MSDWDDPTFVAKVEAAIAIRRAAFLAREEVTMARINADNKKVWGGAADAVDGPINDVEDLNKLNAKFWRKT